MNYHNGRRFLQKKREKNCTKNKKNQVQFVKKRKWEETIHVHVEVVRSIKNAVVDRNGNRIYCIRDSVYTLLYMFSMAYKEME